MDSKDRLNEYFHPSLSDIEMVKADHEGWILGVK
jgi:hypothetical protein